MTKSAVLFLPLVLFVLIQAKNYDLPDYFPRCYRNDPKLNDCLLKATETVKPFLVAGVPELGINPIEPYLIPQIDLEQGTDALNFKATIKNVSLSGLSSYKFDYFKFDVPNMQFFCQCKMSEIKISGKFVVKGKILIAPIEGEGIFNAGIDSATALVYQKVKVVTKRGREFLEPVITNSSVQATGPKIDLQGLFEGNEQLNKGINDVIKDNIDLLFEDFKPVIEKIVSSFIEDLIYKKLEDQVAFDNLYRIKT